jgi:hypothetical protein
MQFVKPDSYIRLSFTKRTLRTGANLSIIVFSARQGGSFLRPCHGCTDDILLCGVETPEVRRERFFPGGAKGVTDPTIFRVGFKHKIAKKYTPGGCEIRYGTLRFGLSISDVQRALAEESRHRYTGRETFIGNKDIQNDKTRINDTRSLVEGHLKSWMELVDGDFTFIHWKWKKRLDIKHRARHDKFCLWPNNR